MARAYRTFARVSPIVLALCAALSSPDAVAAPPKKAAAAAPSKEELAKKEAMELGAKASRLKDAKQYEAALVEGKKAVSILEKVDPESGTMKSVLLTLSETCKEMGDFRGAAAYADRRLAVVEKRPDNDADLLFRIEETAEAHDENGEHERAITLCERALPIALKRDGQKEGEHVANVVSIIAKAQKGMRRWADAEASFLRVIRINDQVGRMPGGLHSDLVNLADMYRELGWYTKAEPVLERAVELAAHVERMNGRKVMLKLIFNRASLEKYREAEALLDELTAITAAVEGRESLSFASALAVRGAVDVESGAYDHAKPTVDRATAIVRKHEEKGEKSAASLRAALAIVAGRLATAEGDFPSAEASLEEARLFFEKNGNTKEQAEVFAALAELWQKARRFERAEAYAAKALAIRDAELVDAHPSKAEARAMLGRIREARGDAAGARKLHAEALAMREAAFGKEHPFSARSRLDLADLARRQGRFDEAEPEYKRAIGIFEKNFGPDHETVAAGLEGLSSLYASTGKLDLAVRTAERAAEIRERQAALVIAGGSEAKKRAFVATMRAGSEWVASLHARIAPTDERAKKLALTTILQRKGRVLDVMASSLAALRQRLSPKDAALFDELSKARADVAELAMRGPAGEPLDSFRSELAAREAKARAIEDKLGSENGGELRAEQLPVTIERVQALVPEGAAMIELSAYTPRRSADADMPSREATGAPRIAAYVLDSAGRVSFVDLGESAPIEAATSSLRQALSSPSTQDPKASSRALFALTMQKILPLVPGKTRLYVSADGALSLVPFAALVDEAGKYLVERFDITYLTSGRDLLRLARKSPSGSGALVVANPAFGPRASGESALALLDEPSGSAEKNRGLDKAYFEPLPATAAEARAIAGIMPRAEVRVDVEATEALLKKSRAPRVLHVATHGFFLSAKRPLALPPSEKERGLELERVASPDWLPDDPLLRSGIALTGANSKNGGGGEDGILTALEASSLDLWGTKLVVLSACETGLGDVQRGEGVYGLRRALFMAGAETLVVSLWKVADEETKSMMIGYYDRVLKGKARGAALRDVQLSMLATPATSHPYYWASFGVFGDPSPLGAEAEAPSQSSSPKAVKVAEGATVKITPSVRGCACRVAEPEDETSAFSGALLLGLLGGAWFRRRSGRIGDKVGPR